MKLNMKKIFMWILLGICVVVFALSMIYAVGVFLGAPVVIYTTGWTGNIWAAHFIGAVLIAMASGFGIWILDGVL